MEVIFFLSFSRAQVLGCHMHVNRCSSGHRYVYSPMRDGSGCTCAYFSSSNYLNATCVATCVATCASAASSNSSLGVRNHSVVSHYEKGVVRVNCSDDRVALGCGVAPVTYQIESYRNVFLSSRSSCECHFHYGATCYAICGLFGEYPSIQSGQSENHSQLRRRLSSSSSINYSRNTVTLIIFSLFVLMHQCSAF